MYCSTCGSAVSRDLSYCNRCGVKVTVADVDRTNKPAELSLDSLVQAIAAVFIVGLGVIIGLMAVMKKVVGVNEGIILTVMALCFLIMIGIESVLIWMLLSGRRGAKEARDTVRLKENQTNELGEAQARALAEPVPSVTEQTTRAFEPIYGERKSN